MKYIREYLDMIKNGPFRMCKEQKQLAKFIEKIFKEEKPVHDLSTKLIIFFSF